jgi:hypothetical protein
MLNVGLTAHEFIGETSFAGVPKVTVAEINRAIDTQQEDKDNCPITNGIKFCQEKIGNDGKMHKTDKWGDFLEDK